MSDILIKGMEMPRHGMVINIYADGRVSNHFDEFCETIATAVPVPPHGRCIDVDALIKSLSLDEDDAENGASLLMAIFIEVLKAAPTIIPAEDSRLSATIKCGGAVTCKEYVDTAGNLRWTGTHSGKHIIPAEEGE